VTDSIAAEVSSATVLPSDWTSLTPQDQRYGYQNAGPSTTVRATVCPMGAPRLLRVRPDWYQSCHILGNTLTPISSCSDCRYTTTLGVIAWGNERHVPPTWHSTSHAG